MGSAGEEIMEEEEVERANGEDDDDGKGCPCPCTPFSPTLAFNSPNVNSFEAVNFSTASPFNISCVSSERGGVEEGLHTPPPKRSNNGGPPTPIGEKILSSSELESECYL